MTTPAVNENFATAGVYNRKVYSPVGALVVNDNFVVAGSRHVRVRPASTNSPRRADGTRPPKNWSSSGGKLLQSHQHISGVRFDGYRYEYDGLVLDPTSLVMQASVTASELRAQAIRNALGHFGEAQQKVGVALQEAKKTGRLLAEYYQQASAGLGKLTDLAQSSSGKSFRRQMRNYASGWKKAPSEYLKYLYGLRPLVGDVAASVDLLTEYRSRGISFRMTLRGKFQITDVRKEFIRPPAPLCQTAHVLQRQEIFSKASLVFLLPSWYWDELPTVTAFSENWEVVPYSFIVDWALPVGTFLRGFEGLQLRPFFQEGSTTIFKRGIGREVLLVPRPGYKILSGSLACQEDLYEMTREAFFTFPSESVLRLPRFRSILQLSHLDDAAALFGQRLAGFSRSFARI